MLIERPKVWECSRLLLILIRQWLNSAQGKAQSHFLLAHLGNWGRSLVALIHTIWIYPKPRSSPLPHSPCFSTPIISNEQNLLFRTDLFPALISPRILSGGSNQQQVDHRKGYCQNIPLCIVWGSSTARRHTKAAGWGDDSARWKAVLLCCVMGSTSCRISTSIAAQGIFKDICLSQPCATTWLPEKPRRAPEHNISQRVTVRALVCWN